MKKILIALIAALALYMMFGNTDEPPPTAVADSLRATTTGSVIGFEDVHDTYAWLGIPYAASTAGENRWRAPQPPAAWEGTREALAYGSACPQLTGVFGGADIGADDQASDIMGSEDCLTLNVWAPQGSNPDDKAKLPVMVWIHGGGNTIGYSGQYPSGILAGRKDLVVVTINYRLGLLGWFSHPALRAGAQSLEDASGNYGTLDTVAALAWVRDNIAAFGGDPGNVTVFGESAGGRNVYMLIASPLARGLFHKAIVQSGVTPTTLVERAENYTDQEPPGLENSSGDVLLKVLVSAGRAKDRESAKQVVTTMSHAEIAEFLRAQSVEDLMADVGGQAGLYPAPQTVRDGLVLPKQPMFELFKDPSRYNSVPIVTGTNRDEMKLFMGMDPAYSELWLGIIPRIRNQATFDNDTSYHSDRWKLAAVDMPADIMARNGHDQVYTYRFDWDEGGSLGIVDWSTALGAAHAMEIPFVFGDFPGIFPIPRLFTAGNESGRRVLSEAMMDYWTQFARTGRPGTGGNAANPAWTPWLPGRGGTLLLDTGDGGGIRMSESRLVVADFRRRLENDTLITDPQARCAMYASLFDSDRWSRDLLDPDEFAALGCSR